MYIYIFIYIYIYKYVNVIFRNDLGEMSSVMAWVGWLGFGLSPCSKCDWGMLVGGEKITHLAFGKSLIPC